MDFDAETWTSPPPRNFSTFLLFHVGEEARKITRMNTDVQRRFFMLEFSSWSENFLRYMSATIIALLGVVLAQSFFAVGGVDAQYLIWTFGLLVLTVGAQFLVFWARIGHGFRTSGITMYFFPWLALLCLDAFWLSQTPWRAEYALCVNMLPLMAFFAAIHVSRTKRTRWWLIAITAMLTLASGLFMFLRPDMQSSVAQTSGDGLGNSVRVIFGGFEYRVGIGALLLLSFFPMASLVTSPRFKIWVRLFGVYVAALFLLGIAFTRHFGVYLGFFVGCMLAVFLMVRRRSSRWICIAGLAVAGAIALWTTDSNVGCLRTVPVPEVMEKTFSDEERLAGTQYVLPHAAMEMFASSPVFGVGANRFGDEFEKYRPPQWQTDPRTAGSLVLNTLAEHGIVGMLTLFAPLVLLLVMGIRACRALPWQADTERAALRRKMGILDLGTLPEERIALASTLSGLLGVGVLFAVDYPQNIPGVSIACGIFGGIAGFLISLEWRRKIIYSGARRHVLLPIAFFVPVVLFAVFLPYFRTEAEFQQGEMALRPFFLNPMTGRMTEESPDFRSLDVAETHLRSALRKNPDHGDAWAALAEKFIFDCQRDPMNTAAYGACLREATDCAMSCSDAVPQFYQLRAAAELMENDFDAAREDLHRADAMRPFNVQSLLFCAEALRSFPQGVDEAAKLLTRVSALLPNSGYVESLLALISMGDGNASGDNKDSEPAPQSSGQFVLPEF